MHITLLPCVQELQHSHKHTVIHMADPSQPAFPHVISPGAISFGRCLVCACKKCPEKCQPPRETKTKTYHKVKTLPCLKKNKQPETLKHKMHQKKQKPETQKHKQVIGMSFHTLPPSFVMKSVAKSVRLPGLHTLLQVLTLFSQFFPEKCNEKCHDKCH